MKLRNPSWVKEISPAHAHVNPPYTPEVDDTLKTTDTIQHGNAGHPYQQRSVQRPSFRETVRSYLAAQDGRGVPRTEVMEHFSDYPTTKVTIALNELLFRREAYLRAGIYRLTEKASAPNRVGLVINRTT
ncbi:MAG: hypothetical protein EOP83_01725 [Verrucomicrobiaceae bacterium]|nr:MAG: hypothetical protein EOP83_01725 [Verrucomicrobiaceae bacterium]